MQITAAGWARNHGAVTVFETDLTTVEATEGHFTFSSGHPVLRLNKGWSKNVRQVTLNCFATMRFTGDYKLAVTVEKEEIARLYRLTHATEIEALQQKIEALRAVSNFLVEPEAEPEPVINEPSVRRI